jgi:hypothetical protein
VRRARRRVGAGPGARTLLSYLTSLVLASGEVPPRPPRTPLSEAPALAADALTTSSPLSRQRLRLARRARPFSAPEHRPRGNTVRRAARLGDQRRGGRRRRARRPSRATQPTVTKKQIRYALAQPTPRWQVALMAVTFRSGGPLARRHTREGDHSIGPQYRVSRPAAAMLNEAPP